jgi:hypothetical protein
MPDPQPPPTTRPVLPSGPSAGAGPSADPPMTGHDGRPLGWRFDFEAADTAARELELTGQSLMEVAALLEADVPVVAEDWEGRLREVFDVESMLHDTAARTLANDMLLLAAAIRAKAVEAAAAWVP